MTSVKSLQFYQAHFRSKQILSCLRNCALYTSRPQSSFVAPERPKLADENLKTAYVEGREDPKQFSSEYIPPLVRPEWHQNKLKYRLERMDCLRRRNMIDIPEFYPGSIVAVTIFDTLAPGTTMRFAGRCLFKDGFGLGCKFLLRNIMEGEGIEMLYHLYSPLIKHFEVLRLEKWVDTDLRYLRDADPKWCTIDPNMPVEAPPPPTEELEVFKGKVTMLKKRWSFKFNMCWPPPYNAYLHEDLVEEENIKFDRMKKLSQSHLKYDICRHYDTTNLKKEILKEMKINQLRIQQTHQVSNKNSSPI